MIDEKKIEAAARRNADKYRNYPTLSDEDRDKVSIGSFMDCSKWMQKEFLKDLWHPADKNPKKYHKCLVEVVYHRPLNMTDEIDYITSHLTNFGWDEYSFKRSDYTINRWIYIDDLLKGCNHD